MPLAWDELADPRNLAFTPERALAQFRQRGDPFRRVLELRQELPQRSR